MKNNCKILLCLLMAESAFATASSLQVIPVALPQGNSTLPLRQQQSQGEVNTNDAQWSSKDQVGSTYALREAQSRTEIVPQDNAHPREVYFNTLNQRIVEAPKNTPSVADVRLHDRVAQDSVAYGLLKLHPNLDMGVITFQPLNPHEINVANLKRGEEAFIRKFCNQPYTYEEITTRIDQDMVNGNNAISDEDWYLMAGALKTSTQPDHSANPNLRGNLLAEYILLKEIDKLESRASLSSQEKLFLSSLYYELSEIYKTLPKIDTIRFIESQPGLVALQPLDQASIDENTSQTSYAVPSENLTGNRVDLLANSVVLNPDNATYQQRVTQMRDAEIANPTIADKIWRRSSPHYGGGGISAPASDDGYDSGYTNSDSNTSYSDGGLLSGLSQSLLGDNNGNGGIFSGIGNYFSGSNSGRRGGGSRHRGADDTGQGNGNVSQGNGDQGGNQNGNQGGTQGGNHGRGHGDVQTIDPTGTPPDSGTDQGNTQGNPQGGNHGRGHGDVQTIDPKGSPPGTGTGSGSGTGIVTHNKATTPDVRYTNITKKDPTNNQSQLITTDNRTGWITTRTVDSGTGKPILDSNGNPLITVTDSNKQPMLVTYDKKGTAHVKSGKVSESIGPMGSISTRTPLANGEHLNTTYNPVTQKTQADRLDKSGQIISRISYTHGSAQPWSQYEEVNGKLTLQNHTAPRGVSTKPYTGTDNTQGSHGTQQTGTGSKSIGGGNSQGNNGTKKDNSGSKSTGGNNSQGNNGTQKGNSGTKSTGGDNSKSGTNNGSTTHKSGGSSSNPRNDNPPPIVCSNGYVLTGPSDECPIQVKSNSAPGKATSSQNKQTTAAAPATASAANKNHPAPTTVSTPKAPTASAKPSDGKSEHPAHPAAKPSISASSNGAKDNKPKHSSTPKVGTLSGKDKAK